MQSFVSDSDSRLEFAHHSWVKYSHMSTNFDKRLMPNDGITNHSSSNYIGKIRTRIPASNQITDLVGRFNETESKLYIPCGDDFATFNDAFLLIFDNSDSFKWAPLNNSSTKHAKHRFVVSFDTISNSIIYIGRTVSEPRHFGCIYSNHGSQTLIFLNANNQIEQSDIYEILCLKPTPAKLKHLCCLALRERLHKNQSEIKSLEKLNSYKLLNVFNFQSYLKCNHSLSRGDCIVSLNSKYKLSLETDGKLLYYIDEERKNYIYLYKDVDCLLFHEFRLVIIFSNRTSKSFVREFDQISLNFTDSKLIVSNNGCLVIESPHFDIRYSIQFRDDLEFYLNRNVPDFIHNVSEEHNDDNDESDNDEDDDDDSDDDEDSSDEDSSENSLSDKLHDTRNLYRF